MAASYRLGTVNACGPNFNPENAANAFHKAMKGFGTDEKAIIKLLSGHCNGERQEIKRIFKGMFGKDLEEELKGELSGHFLDLCLYLLMPAHHFDAWCLHKAMKGIGTKEIRLIEILSTKSNSEIQRIKTDYKKLFGQELESAVVSETSGDFRHILVSLVQGNRNEEQYIDSNIVRQDVKDLYNAGERILGTDESVFNKVLALRGTGHLQEVFKLYREEHQRDIEAVISSETSGDTKEAYLAIVKFIKDPPRYFAECLYKCMEGVGTKDDRLMQLVVDRSEIDLKDIGDKYMEMYKTALPTAVADDTSGDYRNLLVSLTNPK
ncbi:annexin A13-like [Ylistrum balloti]|uniref:annexin A13-like n=1 Tax=Ylistrum balloti TaxID=509963 RepID=UPI0029059095|nr:annexin A13-like [Ylistrum balloti]